LTPKPPCRSTQTFEELKLLDFLPPCLNSPQTAYRHQITSHISRGFSFLGLATDTFLYRFSRPRSAPQNSLAGFTSSLHIGHLTFLQSMDFKVFGVGGLQQENRSFDSVFSGQPSFWDLIAPLQSPSMATGMQRVYALHSAFRMTDMVEIEAAIEPCRLLVASFHPSDQFKSGGVVVLGTLLFRAFKLTNNIEYLNEAILILRVSTYLMRSVSE